MCRDGRQLCSRRILGNSDFLWDKMEIMGEFGNALEFDYIKYSWASVKLFLDCLHLIPAGPTDVATLIETVDFCQFEGKTTYDSFELEMMERLMDSVMKTTLPLGTELLISAYLSKVDNFDDRYQQKVVEKITKEAVSTLVFDFDVESELNKRLVALCVQKGVFADNSQEMVLVRILMYGKELCEFRAENLEPTEPAIENLCIEEIFRPDAQTIR